MLCALYNGHVHVMNYENQQMVKDFEVNIQNLLYESNVYQFSSSGVRPSCQMCPICRQKELDHHWLG